MGSPTDGSASGGPAPQAGSGAGTSTPASGTGSGDLPDGTPTVWSRAYWRLYWHVWGLLVVWAACFCVLIAWGLDSQRGAADVASSLPGSCHGSSTGAPVQQLPDNPAVLKQHSTVMSGVPFGRTAGHLERMVEYDVTSNPSLLADTTTLTVEKGLFETAGGDQQYRPHDIRAWAEVRSPTRVLLHVCFLRSHATAPPGIYVGTISITDARVARVDVPFSVSLSYPTWQFIFALWVLAVLPATLYVWLLLGSFTTTSLSIANFRTWVYSRNAIIALGTGMTVSFSFVASTYFRSEAWGTSITEATTLFGGAFAGFVAAAAGVTGAGQDKQPHQMTSPVSGP